MKNATQEHNKATLAKLSQRVRTLHGLGVADDAALDLADAFKQASEFSGKITMLFGGKETDVATVMDMSRKGDPSAITALQTLRMENIDLYVRATLDFSMLYNVCNLAADEQPGIVNTYRIPVAARYAGEDGGTRRVKAVRPQSTQFFNMREIHTDTVHYAMRDINQGTDIASASQKTFDLAWDLQHKINVELFNFLRGGTINSVAYGQGVYRSFNFSGKALTNTLVLHPSINTANLPTTNDISAATLVSNYAHTSGAMSFSVFRAIIDYVEGFRGVFPDGDIEATGVIIMPSSEVSGLLKLVNPVGSFLTKVGETILNSYTKIEYGGRVWTLLGNPLLAPGQCYPILNKKVANAYFKPTFDFEDVKSNTLKNFEERTAVKVFAQAMIEPWRVNALRVQYTTGGGGGISY